MVETALPSKKSLKEEAKTEEAAPNTQDGFLLDLQDKGHNMSRFAQRRNGLGLYTSVLFLLRWVHTKKTTHLMV